MRKFLFAAASLVLLGTQATAQVRPQDCRPVFPVVDPVAAVVPPPAAVVPPPPVQHFNAAWLLIPGLFLTGLIIITTHHHHHNDNVSPA